MRNALGRAERLDVSGEWGSKGSNEYSVAVSQPRIGGQPITVEARAAQLFRNFLRHSSFTEQLRQAAVTVSTCAMPHPASWLTIRRVDGLPSLFHLVQQSHRQWQSWCQTWLTMYGVRFRNKAYVITNHMASFPTSPLNTLFQSPRKSGSKQTLAGTTALTL